MNSTGNNEKLLLTKLFYNRQGWVFEWKRGRDDKGCKLMIRA